MARVDELRSLLTRVDRALDEASPREVASLAREKRLLLSELDALEGPGEESTVDELARRRADRRSAAKVAAPAKRGGQQRRKRSG